MSDLVEFLHARLGEDAAEIAKQPDDGTSDWDLIATAETNYPCLPYISIGKERALAEVEAKRKILAEYERYAAERRRAMNGWDTSEASPILKALALPYAGREGYREEWRP